MVYPDDIEQLAAVIQPVKPEFKTVLLHVIPVVDRISPSLTGCTEIIRRYSCDEGRLSIGSKKEVFLTRPYVKRVYSDVDWNVSHDLYSVFIGIFF